MNAVLDIERLDHPTANEFDRRAAAAVPMIIEHAIDHWKALDAWTTDYLMAKAGTAQVPILKLADESPDGKFFYGGETARMAAFGDCLPLLDGAPPRVYMAGVPVSEFLPMLAEDLGPLDFIAGERQAQRQIWISGRNSKGPLHYDLDDNVHVVLAGRKRFLLFDYTNSPALYPYSALSSETPHFSRVDPADPDLARFPRFREAKGYDVTLRRGQMIYIPAGCWHQVITEEPSLAVNFWLGKKYAQMSTLRVLLNLSARVSIHALTAPVRAIAALVRKPAH